MIVHRRGCIQLIDDSVMDLNLLYSDFLVDDRELMFHSSPGMVPKFHDMDGNQYCAVPAYQHPYPDLARDPLSMNLRFPETVDLAMFGKLVVAGPTPDHINVLMWSVSHRQTPSALQWTPRAQLISNMLWDSVWVPRRISARSFLPQVWRPRYASTQW